MSTVLADHLLSTNKEFILKFIQTGDANYIYKNELNKTCFAHDAAYSDNKDLAKRIFADKILRDKDKAFNIAKDPKYDGYQRRLASMVYKFLIKRLLVAGCNILINLHLKRNN